MGGGDQERAPRWRSTAAAIVDAALTWPVRRRAIGPPPRAEVDADPAAAPRRRAGLPANLIAEALREQVGTPGQRLLGIRTVDRRTGARVELWRSLLLLGSGWASLLLVRRLAPGGRSAEQQRAVEAYWRELREIGIRHADDPEAAHAERRELFDRSPPPLAVNVWRAVGPMLAAGLLMIRLRRRVAPTVEVIARRASHNP
jgi:hypothetical protein